jgi:hypothetical protein
VVVTAPVVATPAVEAWAFKQALEDPAWIYEESERLQTQVIKTHGTGSVVLRGTSGIGNSESDRGTGSKVNVPGNGAGSGVVGDGGQRSGGGLASGNSGATVCQRFDTSANEKQDRARTGFG